MNRTSYGWQAARSWRASDQGEFPELVHMHASRRAAVGERNRHKETIGSKHSSYEKH
jgi:hypothetical protein